jgi:hypothetical protein
MRIKTEKFLCTIDFILIHRCCIESKWKTFWTARARLCFSGILLCLCHMDRFWSICALWKCTKYLAPKVAGPIIVISCSVLMASQNWDDHDRSGKYTATAMAKAYLNSCAPNAILFTIGDNDTFPLWYAQEEHVRTDIKIVNTSLLWRIGISTRWKQNIWSGATADLFYMINT